MATFLVDSRQDLQPAQQAEVLLADIRNALRSEPNPEDMFTTETSARRINGLWSLSLVVTLFSAIMGVLAKSWIVKYASVASKHESGDAYDRWVCNDKAERWYFEKIITAIPVLVQLALLLFLIGFVLQSMDDDPKLSWTVLTPVIFGFFIYIVITVLSLLVPKTPFQTPLSDIFLGLPAFYRSNPQLKSATPTSKDAHRSWRDRPDMFEVLLEIWRMMFNSATPSDVDEAIAELTRKELTSRWWKRFFEYGAVNILHERLKKLMVFSGKRGSKDEILGTYLLALSRFVDYFDKSDNAELKAKLKSELDVFLEPENLLYRWNIFPEPIRALAFCVRTPILQASQKDYDDSEMEELPWETMVHDMLPIYKRDFAIAMCRGLAPIEGKERLRKVSAHSITLSMVKGLLASKYLCNLY